MRHKVSEDGAYGTLKNKSLCATESLCAMPMAHRDRCSARDEVLYAPHGMILENGDSDGTKLRKGTKTLGWKRDAVQKLLLVILLIPYKK
jgi:hypothetical protein